MRKRNYDLVVHLCEHPRGAWLARTLGARWSVAPAMPGRGRFWARSFTHLFPLPKNGRRHQVELNLDALRRIGLQPALHDRKAKIVAGNDAERSISARLDAEQVGESFLHLHPASRWKFKCWTPEKNAQLIDRLHARAGRIVITASPDPAEIALVEEILKRTRAPVLNLAGQLSIKELVALIGRASLSICVDSMPMHVASAVGTPVVALFGPSGENEWGPWRVAHEVVTSTHPCRPCGNDGCGGGKVSECLTTLEVEQVAAAAERLLNAR
jgi:heptosyltransferase-3